MQASANKRPWLRKPRHFMWQREPKIERTVPRPIASMGGQ